MGEFEVALAPEIQVRLREQTSRRSSANGRHRYGRHWTVLGALAMTILIGFEPFLQAIIDYDGQLVLATPDSDYRLRSVGSAEIGRFAGGIELGRFKLSIQPRFTSSISRIPSLMEYVRLLASDTFISRPDFGLAASIFAGLGLTANQTTDTWAAEFLCSTGNCTWTPYTSLGVCSRCNDISEGIQVSVGEAQWCTENSRGGCDPAVTIIWKDTTIHTGEGVVPYTSHFLRTPFSDLTLSNWQHQKYDGSRCPMCETATVVANTVLSPEMTVSFQNLSTMIIAWTYLAANASFADGKTTWQDTPVTAHECSLYLCSQVLQSRVENGKLHEEVLAKWAERGPVPINESGITVQIAQERETGVPFSNQSLVDWLLTQGDDNYLPGEENLSKAGNSTIQIRIPRSELKANRKIAKVAPQLAGLLPDDNLVFNVSRATMGSLVRYLAIDLSGLGRLNSTTSNQLIYPPDFFGNYQAGTGPPPPLVNVLGESENITATFANIAASMTKFMRDTARSSSDSSLAPIQRGDTQTWVIHIRVKWGYLIFPATVLLVGCAVTLAVILRTRGLGLPAWRGSALVTLARGLDSASQSRLQEADRDGQLKRGGREMRVSLVDVDGIGPQLSQVGSPAYKGIRLRFPSEGDSKEQI